ncbi:hypothetical protein CMEL01_03664 [Colletotrichum melonis]|uniref:Uncharacterized protein n=1 Tax=Colletotrichum melonis TaxID=1209925 RepID=A0AAI9UF79_9PEZI|nr:hypothetical protein CMEL01_03664 [Colletotrichum melonis]
MGSSRKNNQPAPAPPFSVDEETSSTTARCGSPSRSKSKTTKITKAGQRKGTKSSKNEHVGEDLAFMGAQFS